jgi:hypothetical protein
MTRVVLHINRLVLRGVERGDAEAVSTALQAQLQAQLSADAGAAWRGLAGTHRLRAAQVTLPPDADAAALGSAVAVSIAGITTPTPAATQGGGQ